MPAHERNGGKGRDDAPPKDMRSQSSFQLTLPCLPDDMLKEPDKLEKTWTRCPSLPAQLPWRQQLLR